MFWINVLRMPCTKVFQRIMLSYIWGHELHSDIVHLFILPYLCRRHVILCLWQRRRKPKRKQTRLRASIRSRGRRRMPRWRRSSREGTAPALAGNGWRGWRGGVGFALPSRTAHVCGTRQLFTFYSTSPPTPPSKRNL